MPAGRPTRYRADYARQAEQLCRLGATDKDLSEFFGVSEVTINAWKKKHPKFLNSLKQGKGFSDEQVEESLFNRATGYSHPETKVFCQDGEIITHEVTKHYPPDATSMIFWLKNRQPEKWREKTETQHSLSPETLALISKIGDMSEDQLEALERELTGG